jgi:hypothetical protein
MSGRIAIVVAILSVAFVPSIGHADRFDTKEKVARTACLAGDYAKGVQLLSELFVDTKDPTFIFNQGRCFEQNRKYDDAIARFQEYLRAARKASKAEREEAQKHISDCQDLLAKEKAQAGAVAPVVPVTPQVPAAPIPAPTATLAGAPPPRESTASPQSDSGAALRTAGIVAASIGGAGLVAGVVFNLKSNSLASDLKNTDGYTPTRESDRKTYRVLGWVGYGVGAAALATGAILYVLGLRSGGPTDHSTVAFAPVLAPGQLGLGMKGAF